MEEILDTGTNLDDTSSVLDTEFHLDDFIRDVYSIIVDKAEGEAWDKIKAVPGTDGLEVYMNLYRWFTEISGLGLTSQAMKLMHPDPPKREEDIAECLDNWVERVRRLESHGTKYA